MKHTSVKATLHIRLSHCKVTDMLQAVALVFDHVLVEMQQSSSSMTAEPASPIGASESGNAKGPDTPTARGHGTTNAALKLLDDLCMMATGDLSRLVPLRF